MTISSSTSKNQYIANGTNTVFAYSFKIFDDDDIRVLVNDVAQTKTTNYSVSGVGVSTGGNITFTSAPANGAVVTIKRNEPLTQEIDFVDGDDYPPEAHEEGLDRSVIRDQFLQEQIDRSFKFSAGSTITDIEFDLETYKGKLLGFNSTTGQPEAVEASDESATSVTATGSSTSRLLADRFADMANVKDFGAIGDGITNDINAFVSAYNTGVAVIVPDGTYTITVSNQTQANAIMGMMANLHLFCDKLTVNFASGVYTFSARTTFNVTNGHRMEVKGVSLTTLTFSSLSSITSNGAGDHDIVISLVDATNVAVNDYVLIKSTTGTNEQEVLEGIWKVTNKAGNNITVKNTSQVTSFSATPTLSAATIKKFNTVLSYTNSAGFYINSLMGADSGEISGFSNIALVGDGSANNSGVFVEYGCSVSLHADFGIHGFGSFGVYPIYNGVVYALDLYVCGCGETGVYSLNNSTVQAVRAIANGNGTYGFVSSAGGHIAASTSKACGNVAGYRSLGKSSIICNNLVASYNSNYGIDCREHSYVDATGASSKVNRNGITGLYARQASYIDFTSGNASNNTTFDAQEFDILSDINGGTFGTSSLNTLPSRVLSTSLAHTFGTIAAQSQATQTVTLSGVSTGDTRPYVVSNGTHVDGLVLTAHPSATDEITIIASNIKSTSISVGLRTYFITALKF